MQGCTNPMELLISLLTAAALCCPCAGAAPAPPRPAPEPRLSAEAIANAVRQLGNRSSETRQRATAFLRRADVAALPALRTAERGTDTQVAAGAAALVDAIHFGLEPSTPEAVRKLVRTYRHSSAAILPGVVEKLVAHGEAGRRVVRAIARAEADEQIVKGAFPKVSRGLFWTIGDLGSAGRFAEIETLLRVAAASGTDLHIPHFVAYHLLQGTLDREIAAAAELLAMRRVQPEGKTVANVARLLCYLHRAKGDLRRAREVAARSGLDDLTRGVLHDPSDWSDLRRTPPGPRGHGAGIGTLGKVASYHRLRGDAAGLQETIGRIRAHAARDPDDVWFAAQTLFLNRLPEEGIDLLAACGRYDLAAEVLWEQRRWRRAREMMQKARDAQADGRPWASTWLAQLDYWRGQVAASHRALDELAAEGAKAADWSTVAWVMCVERSIGRDREAFEHCVVWLTGDPDTQWFNTRLDFLFPTYGGDARQWWEFLRRRSPAGTKRQTLATLRDIYERRLPKAQLDVLLGEAARPLPQLPKGDRLNLAFALARTCVLHGDASGAHRFFRACAEASGRAKYLVQSGEYRAERGEWRAAAAAFAEAWKADTSHPTALYLESWALANLGRNEEAARKRKLARLLPLGVGRVRRDLARALAKHGLHDEALAEYRVIWLTDIPSPWGLGDATYHEAKRAADAGDYARAATFAERALLPHMETDCNYPGTRPYLAVPAEAQALRACARLAEGKVDEAMAEARLGVAMLPASSAVPIRLVPMLEKAGHRQEADALFDQVYRYLDQACRELPRFGDAHNELAWMSAKCGRRLDAALEHARTAVGLEPKSASFLDTLAEVHFQLGDVEKAVELEERCVKLDPRPIFRQHLQQYRAALKPAAER